MGRTYPVNVLTKTKIRVSQSSNSNSDKLNLIDCVREVLKIYSLFDDEVGYVQGMNLVCGVVAMHMKEVNSCFVVFR